MDDDQGESNNRQYGEYVKRIGDLIAKCNDIELLDFIFQLLTKSNRFAM